MTCRHMSTAELYVVTYRPLEHSWSHWAIYIRTIPRGVDPDDDDECKHSIYQASGLENELQLDISAANPRNSGRCQAVVFVSSIDTARDLKDIETKLEEQPMMNDIPTWDCQDWVMESLEMLEDEELLDISGYNEAKMKLEELYRDE